LTMAIIDWPTTRPFQGASLQLDLSTSRSGFAGYYTGNRQTVSHLADRRLATLTLPPCRGADGPARQAFLHGLMSRGDWLRMGVPHQPYPRGTLRGSPTVATSVAAGARSVSLQGARALDNLILQGSFESDANGDGVADGWDWFIDGAYGAITLFTYDGPLIDGSYGARFQVASVSAFVGYMGFVSPAVAVEPGTAYTASADMDARESAAVATCSIRLGWLGVGGTYIDAATATFDDQRARRSVTAVAPAGAVSATVFCFATQTVSASTKLHVDNVQLQAGGSGSAYLAKTLAAGDWLSIGGNLVQVDYPGATLSDAGAGAVPLVAPLQRPITAGAAVTWANPTGLWELDADSLPLNFNPGAVADGVALPLREVFA
jgi:hypothetical protein